jgi:multicomponent Na+:H+ antiporter subunit G
VILLDVIASALFLGGAVLALAAGVGLVRFPDLLARMHTAAKPQVLGLLLVLSGLALRLRDGTVVWMLLLVALFQLITSPVAAHMVARAGYRTNKVDSSRLVVDELTRDLAVAAGVTVLGHDESSVGAPQVADSGVTEIEDQLHDGEPGPDAARPGEPDDVS